MQIKYFEDTDTALFELGSKTPAETRELSEVSFLRMNAKKPGSSRSTAGTI